MHPLQYTDAVDLFAGPGGWDLAARWAGLDVVGIEFDAAACETRRAAGLATIEGDVRAYGPADFPRTAGLIASPPCQTFSMAGKGAGRNALDAVLSLMAAMADREAVDLSQLDDERTGLVLEPLRWILQAYDLGRAFEWIALEQVPTVLPVWEAMADVLRDLGYFVATGNLQTEQYGVPQTRKRAILVARLDGEVQLPAPTHSKYYNRSPDKLDDGVLPWVSMAEALGWECDGSVSLQRGRGMIERHGDRPSRDIHTPAPTIRAGSKGSGPNLIVRTSMGTPKVDGRNGTHELDPATRPAHTVTTKTASWTVQPAAFGNMRQPHATIRPLERPAGTLTASMDNGDFRWLHPDSDGRLHSVPSDGITVTEAAVLQSFPPDYPWQGSRTRQYEQVGNAIPPLLARAVLAQVALATRTSIFSVA